MENIQTSWSAASKIAFRFFFVYFILYVLPFPFGFFDINGKIFQLHTKLWYAFIPWVGKHILNLPTEITVFPNGSGDTTYNYVHVFTLAALSLLVCVVWSAVDRRRKSYDQAFYWGMIAVRYYLGTTMIGYGIAKIFMMQFGLYDARLFQTYGESSPMGLLWTFMGYSPAYNFFTGFGETLGGVLVMFRRTATTGALLLFAILSNVVILNFAYDVPVKLYSSHLLLMTIGICLMDGRRILNFLLNRPVEPRHEKTFRTEGRIGQIRFVGNFVLIVGWLIMESMTIMDLKKQFAPRPRSPLYGSYEVIEFVHDGLPIPDTLQWRSFRIGSIESAKAIHTRDKFSDFELKVDTARHSFRLDSPRDLYMLTYKKSSMGDIELTGTHTDISTTELRKRTLRILLKKTEKDYLLVNRGFNWINEYPYNR